MKLYHYQVFMPKLNMPTGIIELDYSGHALRESKKDRYGHIKLPQIINTDKNNVTPIEVETEDDGTVNKVVYRLPLDNTRDLCVVVLVATGRVKTVWVNLKSDQHKTLDARRYVRT